MPLAILIIMKISFVGIALILLSRLATLSFEHILRPGGRQINGQACLGCRILLVFEGAGFDFP